MRGRGGCLGLGVSLGSLCESSQRAVRRGLLPSSENRGLFVPGGSSVIDETWGDSWEGSDRVNVDPADIQRKPKPSPRISIPGWKSNPNPILLDKLPSLGDTRLHFMGSHGKGFAAGRVSVSMLLEISWLMASRPQAQSGLWRNLRSIWDNMFTLPKGIRTVCFIQFFAL